MITIEKQVHGIKMITVWFAKKPVTSKGIIVYKQATFKPVGKSESFDTLITDLTETEEEIRQHFAKSCKYKINRAPRENVTVKIKNSSELNQDDIIEFLDFFEEFWESKGVKFTSKKELKEEIELYLKQNAFTLSIAYIDGKKTVYHTHVYDDSCARLLHSASLYRELSKEDSTSDGNTEKNNAHNLVGMANRYLHYEEIRYFKNMGLTTYDWGGAGTAEEVRSITEFKQSFGGTPLTCYDFSKTNGWKAKCITLLSNIKSGMKR